MVCILEDTSKVQGLFEGWEETLIWSCLQKVMGSIYVTDPESPRSALAFVGCFGFFAGEPDRDLAEHKPEGFAILVPGSEEWASLLEICYPDSEKATRYAIRKDTRFDRTALKRERDSLPAGYELREIDAELYDLCLEDPVTRDFVSVFDLIERGIEGSVINKVMFHKFESRVFVVPEVGFFEAALKDQVVIDGSGDMRVIDSVLTGDPHFPALCGINSFHFRSPCF